MNDSDGPSKGMGFSPSIEPAEQQAALAAEEERSLRPEDFYMEGPYLVFTAALPSPPRLLLQLRLPPLPLQITSLTS